MDFEKGMVRKNDGGYKFRNWAREVKIKYNYTCKVCGYVATTDKDKQNNVVSHHIIPYENGTKTSDYDVNNGICMCRKCHTSYHKNNPEKTSTSKHKNKAYRRWAKSVKERDNFTCNNCGFKAEIVDADRYKKLHAHHIEKFTYKNNEKDYELSNGITLCPSCHAKLYGNRIQSEETREYQRQKLLLYYATHKGSTELLERYKKIGDAHRGKSSSTELHKKSVSEANKKRTGTTLSEEACNNISEGCKKRDHTPAIENLKKATAAIKGKKQSPEQIAKRIASRLKTLEDRKGRK